MNKLGYERIIWVALTGFIILAAIIMVVVNMYFVENNIYDASKDDIQYTKQLMAVTNDVNQSLAAFETSLAYQADVLELAFNSGDVGHSNVTDKLVYLEEDLVSATNPNNVSNAYLDGAVVVKGKPEDMTVDQARQINQFQGFFDTNAILFQQEGMDIPSIFYSDNDYLVYYPYQSSNLDNIAYFGVFENIKTLVDWIYDLAENEQLDAVEEGWSRTALSETSGLVTVEKSYPIVMDNRIAGILVGRVTTEEIRAMLGDVSRSAEVYVINDQDQIIYSSKADVSGLESVTDSFKTSYDIKYYQNQFPQSLEIREEDGYRVYISEVDYLGWSLVYVVKDATFRKLLPQIIFNVFMVLMSAFVIFIAIRYTRAQHNKLATDAKKSKFDAMTELLNHEHIKNALKLYLNNKRIRQISVLMIDIDHFKAVNDTYGHAVGDDVIKMTAKAIEEALNNYSGVAGRYGGEEFMVILPRVDQDVANHIADRIHSKISHMIAEELDMKITVSVGIHYTVLPVEETPADLINYADKNLYEAKENGRNQVVRSSFIG